MTKKLISIFEKLISNQKIDIISLFGLTLVIYIHNLSPSVYGGDSGDFLTASLTRGIPHPSGYPLYTILGIIFTSLPISGTPAWKFALSSAIISSISVVICYFLLKELTNNRYLSIVTSLTLAFLYPFWLFAEIVEVISLNSLFILTLLLLIIKYINTNKQKYIYALAFITGLSLTNNLTILLLFPAIFLAIVATNRKIFLNFGVLLKGAGLFLLGLVPYFYIPFAARNNPLVNWGRAVTYQNFIALVLRKDYGWFHTKSFNSEVIINALKTYGDYWLVHFNMLIPITTFLGVTYLFLKKRYILLVTLLISYLLFGPLFIIYGFSQPENFLRIGTFEKFYVAGFIILLIFFPFGIAFIQEVISKLLQNKFFLKLINIVLLIIVALIPLTFLIVNFERTNLRNVYIGDNYALDILTPLPDNSVLLLQGDSTSFNSLYMQFAYNLRTDVYIPGRHEGFTQMLSETDLSDDEIKEYQIAKRGGIDREVMAAAIAPILSKRPVFSDTKLEIIDSVYGRIVPVPYGLLYKLEFENKVPYAKKEYLAQIGKAISLYHVDELRRDENLLSYNLVLADIKKWYSIAFDNIAEYLNEEYKDPESASYYLRLAGELDPLK